MTRQTFSICLAILMLHNFRIGDSARILCVFPFPSRSHQYVFRTLTEELLQLGHELVVVTTEPGYLTGEAPANLTEIYVHEAALAAKAAFVPEMTSRFKNHDAALPNVTEVFHNIFMYQYHTEEFQRIIKDGTKFDLLLLQATVSSSLVLSHIFKAPVIAISSFGPLFDYGRMGTPRHPFIYPLSIRKNIVNISFWDELIDIYNLYRYEKVFVDDDFRNKEFRKILGDDCPTMDVLWDNVDLMIVNLVPIWEGIRPVTQNVIHAGGILPKARGNREIPQDVQHFLDSSTNGVIYVSFGTLVPISLLSKERVQIMVNVFSKLPYDVLWKWDQDKLPGMGENIKTFKWLPQAEVLKHPKLKLIITHGGLHSTDEAILAGVPLIGIPFVTDQFFNSEMYLRHNIGLKLNYYTLTEDKMEAAITKVMTNESYRTNVVRLRALIRDQPLRAQRQVARWVQYVLRHGGARHLRAPAAGLPWTRYLELELLAIVLTSVALLAAASAVLLYHLYKYLIKLSKKLWSRIVVSIRSR